MIPSSDIQIIRSRFAPVEKLNPWQWAEANIDYSRAKNYDSDWKLPYSADYLPYLKEPLEACADMSIKEVWCWACTRGGKSENFLLTVMRWMLATCPPYSMLYIGGQQTKVEQFFEKRILRGMDLAAATSELMKRAKVREHTVDFGGLCDLVVSWAANKQVAKGDSFPVIFADEVSSWPGFKSDVLRERQATVPFPKLIGVSSADAESKRTSEEDPIIQEWEATDRREFMMDDPGAVGQQFGFRMGGPDTIDGIKWSPDAKLKDGSWDLDIVEQSAHYVTPGGVVIAERDRMSMLSGGRWVATAKAPVWKRGYRVTRMMTPFPTGRFGNMARTFLEANRKQKAGQHDEDGRPPLRVFVYERLAEKYYSQKVVPEVAEVEKRKGAYLSGQRPAMLPAFAPMYAGKPVSTFLTMDVQKDCVWWAVREWYAGGDSSLVDFGQAMNWQELREIGLKFKVRGGMIDNSYTERRDEIIEAVTHGLIKGMILSYGRDNLRDVKGMPRDYDVNLNRDPYEGTARQGAYRCHSVTFHPDRMKNHLYSLVMGTDQGGHIWRIPENISPGYIAQMTSEQSIDGHWQRINRDNHIWDCEVLQLLAAKIFGMYSDYRGIEETVKDAKPPVNAVPVAVESPVIVPKYVPIAGQKVCPHCGKGPVVNQECKACRAGVSGSEYRDGYGKFKDDDV